MSGEVVGIIIIVVIIIIAIVIGVLIWYLNRNINKNNSGGGGGGGGGGGLPVGSFCDYDSDCSNGACGRQTANDGAPLICCPSNQTTTYDAYDYCTQMGRGDICWSDAMCASGNCAGNAGGLQKGVCS